MVTKMLTLRATSSFDHFQILYAYVYGAKYKVTINVTKKAKTIASSSLGIFAKHLNDFTKFCQT